MVDSSGLSGAVDATCVGKGESSASGVEGSGGAGGSACAEGFFSWMGLVRSDRGPGPDSVSADGKALLGSAVFADAMSFDESVRCFEQDSFNLIGLGSSDDLLINILNLK